jgi:hypothetical protein
MPPTSPFVLPAVPTDANAMPAPASCGLGVRRQESPPGCCSRDAWSDSLRICTTAGSIASSMSAWTPLTMKRLPTIKKSPSPLYETPRLLVLEEKWCGHDRCQRHVARQPERLASRQHEAVIGFQRYRLGNTSNPQPARTRDHCITLDAFLLSGNWIDQ